MAKLGLAQVANVTASDAAGEDTFELANGRLTGSVGPRDYRLILLAGEGR